MTHRTARRLAWSLWTLDLLLLVVLVVFTTVSERRPEESSLEWLLGLPLVLGLFGYATVGAKIASRHPRNPIGWLFLYFGLALMVGLISDEYSVRALRQELPGGPAAVLTNQVAFPLSFGALPLVLLLFPSGTLPSRRWKPVAWGMVASILAATSAILLGPGSLAPGVDNPLGIEGLRAVTNALGMIGGAGSLLMALLAVVGLFVRYRRAGGEERQQIRWLAYVGATAAMFLLLLFASGWVAPGAVDFLWIGFFLCIALGIPTASGIAILRYRLYDLDIVVKKTVVFGVLAAFITIVYVAVVLLVPIVVLGTGEPVSLLPALATVLVALAFQPLRRRANRLANRLVYGKRATPYQLLSEFSGRVGGEFAIKDVLPRMAQVLGEGTGARRTDVWLRVGDELRRAASWPSEAVSLALRLDREDELPSLEDADIVEPVRHRGELLGALSLAKPRGETVRPAEEALLRDLASQAGLVLRNVRLTAELEARLRDLQESRQRLVTAQDQERRRLERNMHDGAQQQLVALSVKMRLLKALARKDPGKAEELVDQLQADTQDALQDLRDLARGIYPPLLADQGLAAALEAQARKAAVPVEVLPDGIGRYPQEAEATAYFCVLEALQNAAKYADPTSVEVLLREEDGHLRFVVTDDGAGFDVATTPRGAGLQNMADRVEALGGELSIVSAPGSGTTVTGRIPVSS